MDSTASVAGKIGVCFPGEEENSVSIPIEAKYGGTDQSIAHFNHCMSKGQEPSEDKKFMTLLEDMKKDPTKVTPGSLLLLQTHLAEKGVYWNLIAKLADKGINATQTLMSSQV